jgi:hypothetical protein
VVTLSEQSTALDVALRHIYPVRTPKGDSLHYASILAEFARKYQVDVLDDIITGYLTDGTERDPVGVYAIAVTYGYNDIGINAVQSCLNLPFSGLQFPYMQCAAVEHILELIRYHVACGEAASAFASSDRTWFSSLDQSRIFASQRSGGIACSTCHVPDPHAGPSAKGRIVGPKILWNYLYRSALVLAHHPTAETVTTEAFVLKTNDCRSCSPLRVDMLEIGVVLMKQIKNVINQVSASYLIFVMYNVALLYVAGSPTQVCFRGTEYWRPYLYKLIVNPSVRMVLCCSPRRHVDALISSSDSEPNIK